MRRAGFTLTEIMVAMAIIVALAAIAVPVTTGVMARSRETVCLQNLGAIGAGLDLYVRDNGGRLPDLRPGRESKNSDAPVIETVLLEHVGHPNLFRCPADSRCFRETGSSYFWNSGVNGMLVSEVSFFGISNAPERIPLVTDKESWHPHETNFLYADSSVENKLRFGTGNRKN